MIDYIDYGQSVINFYILLLGYSLKCYNGSYIVEKDTNEEETEKKPELLDCTGTDQVCLSAYYRTDVIFKKGTARAGSWYKSCATKGGKDLTRVFGEDQSDRCFEQTKGIEVCNINA